MKFPIETNLTKFHLRNKWKFSGTWKMIAEFGINILRKIYAHAYKM